jgi:hypothetical protein
MKIWLFIKFIVAMICGCILTSGFRDIFGMDHAFFGVVRFVVNWVWLSYCWNFYYPKNLSTVSKKDDDDNEINFKDL